MGERFYFGLAGSKALDDPSGLPFDSELAAFRSAEILAKEISATRPSLCGTTCVVVTRNSSIDAYYVSIGEKAAPGRVSKRRQRKSVPVTL
jgi:hypothetical protein